MFNKYHALALASLLGLGAFAMPAGTASAAALPYVEQSLPGESAGNQNLLQEVHRRRWRYRDRDNFGLFFGFGGGGYGYGYPYRYQYPYGYRYSRYGGGCHSHWTHSGRVRHCPHWHG